MKKKWFVLVVAVMLVMVGCGSKPTLAEWVESDDIVDAENLTNEELAASGLGIRAKYSADGEDILVISYIFDQYQQLNGLDQNEINTAYAEELNNMGTSRNLSAIFVGCEENTGITLKCIRVQFVNADGTVIYSQEYLDTKE